MESVQTSSQRSPAAAQSVRHAKGAGKAVGADGLSPTPGQGPQDAFAALLGALGEGDSLAPPEPGAEAASASTTLALTDPPAQGLAAAQGLIKGDDGALVRRDLLTAGEQQRHATMTGQAL